MAKDFSLLIKAFEEARDALDAVLSDVATSVSLAAKGFSQRTIMERGFGFRVVCYAAFPSKSS